ncbi:IS110 family RNA-guided transposase [Hyunsoonleella ulvae]|uniref:IS110 family transposase n=1 Tax=Hyunsoonleella ulvae TaxID=2799948 RepID=UPI001939CB8E|nr:IS110 family transposase [Hyunsoonleella ulvae]
MKNEFIGIDVSKNTLEVHLYYMNRARLFKNDIEGRQSLIDWVIKMTNLKSIKLRFCLEHTGIYSQAFCELLEEMNITYYLISGLELKRSMGIKRGKNDKVDAQRIAQYAYLRRDSLVAYKMPEQTVITLKKLLSQRAKIVRQRAGYKALINEQKQMYPSAEKSIVVESSLAIIDFFTLQIRLIEKEITLLIKSNQEILKTYGNIKTIKGVGPILAATMIAYTNNFKSFQNWRKFACYAGIAPFEHSSGTSYRGKTRISALGNRELKTILSLAAATATLHDAQLKLYYHKRLKEGKNKMSTLNIIRNKIVSRIFAVAKRQTPYVETFKFAA